MNTSIRSMMVLMAMFAVGASAQERSCATSLSNADLVAAIGAGVAFQPVFAGGGVKGFRLYNIRHSAQLTAQGIDNGALLTHVCGVPASEIHARRGNTCCSVDASRQFEVTFHQFPYDEPLPLALISRIVSHKVKQDKDDVGTRKNK